jgi:hypothetical protein
MKLFKIFNVSGYLGSISNIQDKKDVNSIILGPSSLSARGTKDFYKFINENA